MFLVLIQHNSASILLPETGGLVGHQRTHAQLQLLALEHNKSNNLVRAFFEYSSI